MFFALLFLQTVFSLISSSPFDQRRKDKGFIRINNFDQTKLEKIYNGQIKLTIKECSLLENSQLNALASELFALGFCYQDGIGFDQDLTKSFELFQKSAKKGNSYGRLAFGQSYRFGFGVEKDFVKAFENYKKSSEQGNLYARLLLGECYETGLGVKKNLQEAYIIYKKLADEGDLNARYELDRIKPRMVWPVGILQSTNQQNQFKVLEPTNQPQQLIEALQSSNQQNQFKVLEPTNQPQQLIEALQSSNQTQQTIPRDMIKFCSQCGKSFAIDEIFCTMCGHERFKVRKFE